MFPRTKFLIPLTLILALFGCRSVASNINREIHLNLGIEPATIDPALATDPGSQQIARMLFLSLVDTAATNGAPEHGLAISWAVSSDGLIWEFKLRNQLEMPQSVYGGVQGMYRRPLRGF